jgi:hypothetical protein
VLRPATVKPPGATGAAAEPRAQAARPAPAIPSLALVTQLQRSAGNAAVTRMLARFEAGEHTQMAGTHSATIGTPPPGIKVEEADLLALGDFYPSAEKMMAAPVSELQAVIPLIHQDRDFRLGKGGTAPTEKDWTTAKPDYKTVLLDNASHFAPGSTPSGPGGDHKSMFFQYHGQALEKAHESAAAGGKTVPNDAIALNAFACHFLTDAFAAGHLFNKQEMLAQARQAWDAQVAVGTFLKETTFTMEVARKILAHPDAATALADQLLYLGSWQAIDATTLSEFVYQVAKNPKTTDKFFNGLVNLVHTRLNRSAADDPASAVEVSNEHGQVWTLSGDGILDEKTPSDSGEETLAIAREAVAESSRNLEAAAKTASRILDDSMLVSVWKWTPTPTQTGRQHMDKLIASALTLHSAETTDAFAQTSVENIATVIGEATKQGYMRHK